MPLSYGGVEAAMPAPIAVRASMRTFMMIPPIHHWDHLLVNTDDRP